MYSDGARTSVIIIIIVIICAAEGAEISVSLVYECSDMGYTYNISIVSLVWRVVELRRVCCELLSKGRKWVATWRTTARGLVTGLGDSSGMACLGVVTLTERLVTAWF